MGLFLTLLTLPVSAPVGGTVWIADQLLAAAEREYYDEGAIRQELEDLDRRLAAGELSEADHEAAADALVERLLVAGELRAERGGVELWPADDVPDDVVDGGLVEEPGDG
ncbi:MAG TPA: gas vesicle protein GvpG [Acidimicrobiales bacterium]